MKELIQLHTFRDVLFDEVEHRYTYDGYDFKSVTTLLSEFIKPFRRDYWAKYKTLQKHNLNPVSDRRKHVPFDHIEVNGKVKHHEDIRVSTRDIFKLWEEMKLEGLAVGSMMHYFMEYRWAGNTSERFIPLDHLSTDSSIRVLERAKQLYPHGSQFVNDHPHLVPIKLEQTVADKEYRLAGKPDAIVHDIVRGTNHIYDYKTDKEITENNSYGDKLLGPLAHLDDCELVKYSLQLGLYKHMLNKHTDLDIQECYIVHFTPDGYEVVQVNDYPKEVDHLITVRSCQL